MHQTFFWVVFTVLKSTVFGCPSACICVRTVVICRDQNLTTVPSGIPNTTTHLYLENNQLTLLDGTAFQVLKSLQTLVLNNNQLTSISGTVFQGLKALIYLLLHGNKLAMIDENAFKGLTALKYLYLSENQLTSINGIVFQGLTGLTYLRLYSNYLTMLDGNLFKGLSVLEELQLEDNQITAVNGKMFEGLTSLSTLTLDNNPLDCTNCDLEQFKFYLQNNTQLGDTGAMCEGILIINYDFTNCNDSPSETSTVNGIRSDSSSTTKIHLIIGSAVGVVALSVFVIVSIFYFYSYQKRKRIVNRIHVGQN